ncbi:MAG: protein kinase [Planctomycetes bacterium]|nr:protein kinase [Planctomycetota bacterium]
MQIRCAACGRVVTLVRTGVLPDRCPHCSSRPVPERLGRFVIERLIAAGGMGEVYLARHGELGTPVAIKLLPPPVAEDVAVLRERFAREARLQSVVEHPGVVRVLDCDVLGDRPYLVLEYVGGSSLRERLGDGPLPVVEAVRICADVADVLAAAHAQGVLHRDIKPENVLVGDDGKVRVLDFGIARARDGEVPVTRTGEIVGTPQYMAPEQLLDAGDEVDERCDIHALGVLAHELLTGQPPFQGANIFAVLKLVESLVPKPPSALRAGVPDAVDRVVQRALAKNREARWPTAAAMAAALRQAMSGSDPALPKRRRSRLRAVVETLGSVGVVATLAALGAMLGGWLGNWFAGSGKVTAPIAEVPQAPVAAVDTITPLLTAPTLTIAEEEQLGAAIRSLARSDDPADRLLRGRARMRLGEYQAAVFDLDGLGIEAREDAAVAWLCAHVLLPLCVDAPRHWARCDDVRKARLFAAAPDPEVEREGEPDIIAVARAIADEDAALAWQQLQPMLDESGTERPRHRHAATLALLAAHLACRDRRVLVRLTPRFVDAAPHVRALLELRLLGAEDVAERQRRLRGFASRLSPDGADRWLYEILAASLDATGTADRLSTFAEMAWLHGGGEAAAVWYVGARLRHCRRTRTALPADELERCRSLLATVATADVPALLAQRLLLDLHGSDPLAAVRSWQLPESLPPSLQFVAAWQQGVTGADGDLAQAIIAVATGAADAGCGFVDMLRRTSGLRGGDVPALVYDLPDAGAAFAVALQQLPADAPTDELLSLLDLAVAAGLQPDAVLEPWSRLEAGELHQRWLHEVCGDVR